MLSLLLLLAQEDWWNADWKHRRQVVVQNNLEGPLASGHPVSLELDPDYLGIAGKAEKDLKDLVLVYAGKEIPVRIREGRRKGRIELWFRTSAEIAKAGRDSRYSIYYGNPSGRRGAGEDVFDFYEDFSAGNSKLLETDSDIVSTVADGKLVISDASADRTEHSPALVRLKMSSVPDNFAVSVDLECEPDPNAAFAFGLRVELKEKIESDEKVQKRIAELVEKLGAFDWEAREEATKELIKIGRAAIPSLEEALKSDDAEIKWRAEHILKEVRDATPWPLMLAGVRVGDAEIGPVAMIWRIGRTFQRQRLGNLGPVKVTLTLERDQDGYATVYWNGGRRSHGELQGEIKSIALFLYKGTSGKPGVIRIDNIVVRRCVDEDSRPTTTVEVEQSRK